MGMKLQETLILSYKFFKKYEKICNTKEYYWVLNFFGKYKKISRKKAIRGTYTHEQSCC